MTEYLSFNVNDYVKVKLTDKGEQHLIETNNEYYKPDDKGYRKFQLWVFIEIFGPTMDIGFDQCFETDILFNKDDLTKVIND